MDFLLPAPQFINDQDFESLASVKRIGEEAINWKDLSLNVVYRVDVVLPLETKWGPQIILQLVDRDGNALKVWSPLSVKKAFKHLAKFNGKIVYIKSLGEKERIADGGGKRKYHDFEIITI